MARARLLILIVSALTALSGLAASAHAATFTPPVKLTGPAGGEPSIAADGRGNAYVSGPQGIPSGANGGPGVGFWKSSDDGATFGPGRSFGSLLGGGDSDVLTTPDGTVYIDDLEAAASQVCKSTDHGNTFTGVGAVPDPGGCTTVAPTAQVGPSDDRPWLTTDPKGTLYLTYHEFVSAQPLAFRSDNGGADSFSHACGSIVTDPTIQANVPQDITGGTLVAKPTTDAAGNFYVLFSTTTQDQNLAAAPGPSGTFSQLYVAVSHDHCATFTDHVVYDGRARGVNNTQFGDVFNVITADGAGNLYAIGAGFVNSPTKFSPTANIYVSSSTDQGQTWKGPTLVGATNAAHMLPAATGGGGAGQLAIGYFQTTNGKTDPNDIGGKWTYTTAETDNALAAQPSFSYSDVNPGFIYHNGQICNIGLLCGLVPGQPGDRSLLDFTSATVDSVGCPLFTFAGNPNGTPTTNNAPGMTSNYATQQLTNCLRPFPVAAGANANGAGGRGGAGGACIAANRLAFVIRRVPHGRVVRAVAYANGRRVARRRGRSLKRIVFARPRAQVVKVKIITTNNKGGSVVTRRTFFGCKARNLVVGRPHRHKVKHRRH